MLVPATQMWGLAVLCQMCFIYHCKWQKKVSKDLEAKEILMDIFHNEYVIKIIRKLDLFHSHFQREMLLRLSCSNKLMERVYKWAFWLSNLTNHISDYSCLHQQIKLLSCHGDGYVIMWPKYMNSWSCDNRIWRETAASVFNQEALE